MSPDPRDPWRELPTRERFGQAMRDLAQEDERRASLPLRLRARTVIASSGGIAAVFVVALLVLTSGHPAEALNIINRAPAAAERSGSVRFRSALRISVDGHPKAGITEHGAIDFKTGAYTTQARLADSGQILERRSLNGVLYSAHHDALSTHVRWTATHLRGGTFATESDAFTDPPAVFRALAGIRAPLHRLGHQRLEGVPTTHYRLPTNLAAFLGKSAGYVENRAAYRQVTATLDVWLDSRGRPRQVAETFSGPSASGRTTMTTSVRFSGYEQPVSVGAPPSGQVRFTHGAAQANPLAALPAALLARLLFFKPSTSHQATGSAR